MLEPQGDLSAYEDSPGCEFFSIIGKRAATNAINENKALGLPWTYLKDNWVVREFPDGTVEKIVAVDLSPLRKFEKKILLHVNRENYNC